MIKSNMEKLSPIFFPSEGNVDQDLFQPVASQSESLDCMVGYFSSGVLSELALTISSYLKLRSVQPMRFIVSPNINETDLAAIRDAYSANSDYFHVLFPNFDITEGSLRSYTVSALAYLVASKKIELRVALKKNGLFHSKAWMFKTPKGGVAIHGSSNATTGGMINNFEQLVLSRSWMSVESEQINDALQAKFNTLWASQEPDIRTIPLNEATMAHITELAAKATNGVGQFKRTYTDTFGGPDTKELDTVVPSLRIPDYLDYQNGKFAHQGEAVSAWFRNDNQGIFSIATGGGKTYTSLIAATELMEQEQRLLIVISVPTKALMNQWEGDVCEFGIAPVNTNGMAASAIRAKVKQAQRNLRLKVSVAEIIIVTHNALVSGLFEKTNVLGRAVKSLLIADEVHNIGSERSQEAFPKVFDYKLGLSATYERQFDDSGTEFLLKTFGDVVYEYGLDRAIGECLVHYYYHAHFVYLTAEEEEDFQELTSQIKRLSFAAQEGGNSRAKDRWQRLCLKRRALVESAANKVELFSSSLPKNKAEIEKTLVFCTDKNPDQLEMVNAVLMRRGVKFHQVTADETSNNKALKGIIGSFSANELQVLTSKRVLDEGFNVPQTESAYLLASNTVVRQWMQRLGRVLRLSPETGKDSATIHDFIVLPIVEGEADDDLKSLIESEYCRVEFFAKYSSNYMENKGGYNATQKLLELLGAL